MKRTVTSWFFAWACAAALAWSQPALGEDGFQPLHPNDASLEVRLTTGVWLARVGGESRLDNSPRRTLNFRNELDLRDLEATFNAELTIRKDDFFELNIGGFSFSTDIDGHFAGDGVFGDVLLSDGDAYRASFDMTSVAAEVRFALYKPYEGHKQVNNPDGRRRVKFRVSPLIGMRYVDVEQTIERIGGNRETVGGEWLAIYGGANLEVMFRPDINLNWFDRFSFEAAGGIGPALGGDNGFMWQVQAGMRVYFTENIAAMIGYRLVELDVENDGYDLRGGLQGLFIAASLKF